MRKGFVWRHWLEAIRSVVGGRKPVASRTRSARLSSHLGFESLEDRLTPSATVQFATGSETAFETVGAFRVPVTVSQLPTPIVSTFASGFSFPEALASDEAGNLFVADFNAKTIDEITPGGVVSTFVTGPYTPAGLAFDAAGDLFFSDHFGGVIHKVTPGGVVSTAVAGLSLPEGMAFDGSGNLYVANVGDGTVAKVTPAGVVSTYATGLKGPDDVAFDAAGNLYVSELYNNTVDAISPGGVVSTFASGLSIPDYLAFDNSGNLYVTSQSFNTVYKVTPGGAVSTYAAGLNDIYGLAFDPAGNLYVANGGNGTVSEFTSTATVPFTLGGNAVNGADYGNLTASPLTFTLGQPTQYVTGTLLPRTGANKTMTAMLGTPSANTTLGSPAISTLTIDESGNNPVPNLTGLSTNSASVDDPATIVALTGSNFVNGSTVEYSGSPLSTTYVSATRLTVVIPATDFASAGTATLAVVNGSPGGGLSGSMPFTVDNLAPTLTDLSPGNVIAGAGNTTITLTGTNFVNGSTVVDFEGAPIATAFGNSTQLTAVIPATDLTAGSKAITIMTGRPGGGTTAPLTLTVIPTVQFPTGNETVSETVGTFAIPVTIPRLPAPAVSTYASGVIQPNYLAFDPAGNLYVSNNNNNTVSEVTPAGVVSILAIGFDGPAGLAFDTGGNLYVSNFGNGTVSEVTPAGVVSTFASGFSNPDGLAFNASGDLFVCDNGNGTLSEVTPSGVVSTLATGFFIPSDVTVDPTGNLFVVSSGNGTVSKVTPAGAVGTFATGFNVPDDVLDVAVDTNGNLYVSGGFEQNVVYLVTPEGMVSTFASGFDFPAGLAFDAAGNLYVSNIYGGVVSELTSSMTVPFTLGGNAVNGTDYANVTVAPLTFTIGQPIQYVTGTLFPDIGANKTITATLDTPGANAALGNVTVNVLTIDESGNNPAPTLTGVGPDSVLVGSGNDTVTLTGVNFVNGTTADFNGRPIATTYVSATQLMAVIPAADLTAVGNASITVVTAGSGGGTSGSQTFAIDNPVPTLANVSPAVAVTGAGNTRITLTGANFVNGSTADFNGTPVATTFVSATQLTAVIPAADLTAIGVETITVESAGPGGGNSAGQTFSISYPPPIVSFGVGNETIAETTGTFRIRVTLTGNTTPTVSTFASGLTQPFGLAFNAGNLYVAMYGANTVDRVTPDGVPNTFVSGIPTPDSLAFDASGNLYVALTSYGTVDKVTPGGAVSTFASGFDFPDGLAFDAAGNLYVSNESGGTVDAVTPGGVVTTVASGFDFAGVLAFDSAGNLYVADGGTNTVDEVTHGVVRTFASGISGPNGMAFDNFGNLYVSNGIADTVSEVTRGGVVHTFATGFYDPMSLVFDAAGNLFVANNGNSTVSELVSNVTVPFTLGGNAVSGTDYSGVTANPLTFATGQTTANITGTLLPEGGANKTITLTLGAPSNNAVLGDITVNTLTIDESNPAPTLTGVSPPSATVGAGNTTITLTGTGFVSGSTATFNSTPLVTTFVSTTKLTAIIPSSDLTSAGYYWITVSSAPPGGGTSGAQTFKVLGPLATNAVFAPSGTWYVRSALGAGAPSVAPFAYGLGGWTPLVGDWNGDGTASIGVVDPASDTFYLRNENGPGNPDAGVFGYGAPGWIPLSGHFNGTATSTIAVVDPKTENWYIRYSDSGGAPSVAPFAFGAANWIPLAGDWNGDGTTSIGVFDPHTATFYLRNENGPGGVDYTPFPFGAPGWVPVVGDWNGDGRDSVGVINPTNGTWYLRNELGGGPADAGTFAYGLGGWKPVAGAFAGPGNLQLLAASQPGPGAAPLTADALAGVVRGALDRLAAASVGSTLLNQLAGTTFTLARLPGNEVGVTIGNHVFLDPNADGYGWFVDPTPMQDQAFTRTNGVLTAKSGSAAAGRVDLLTVVLHEFAHVAGKLDVADGPGSGLMDLQLPLGVRRVDGLGDIFSVA